MSNNRARHFLALLGSIFFIFACASSCCESQKRRTLASFKKGTKQVPYDRETEPYTPIVDSHVHFRPFGGKEIPFNKLVNTIKSNGVRFVNVYGIGQRVDIDSNCIYYLDCPGTSVLPSTKNDMANAESYIQEQPEGIHLTVSMTFPDLANPEHIFEIMQFYEQEYRGVFKWMGEVNLVKQALLANHHEPADSTDIPNWSEFMAELRSKNMPINIHCDLGNDSSTYHYTKYLDLMKMTLETYPNNKIVWAHMGLSKELTQLDPDQHIQIMSGLLEKHANLILDISWSVLEANYFSKYREKYLAFVNAYPERFLPGTDFVAAANKHTDQYKIDLDSTSLIHKGLSDEAFRNIVLGNNYFKLLDLDYEAPPIAQQTQ
ncbi:MAG: amidohydrolase family protein [Cytophagales bacterium]|nr:amidohydrolase family protein [Cytophagales bacterium]